MITRKIATLFALQGGITGAYFALWQVKLLERGYGVAEVAKVIALQTALGLVVEVPTGFLSDHLGPRKLLLVGFALLGIAFILPAISPVGLALAAAVILFGLADATMNGALDSLANGHLSGNSDGSLLHAYIDREHWAGRGRMAGSVLIPALISLLGEPVLGSWWIFVSLSALALFMVSKLPDIQTRLTPHQAPREAIRSSVGAARTFATTGAGFALLMGAFIFGISDGVTSTSFRPRVAELGISASWLLGMVQLGLTAARLGGLALYRRSSLLNHPHLSTISLIGSGILGTAFAVVGHPIAALALWFARVGVLSVYFPSSKALVTQSDYGAKHQASALSVWALVGTLGTLVWSSVISFSGNEALSLQGQLIIGGITSVLAGAVITARKV